MVDEKWHDYSQHDTLLLVSCVAKVDATLAERDKRIAELEAALRLIAACETQCDGDVVDIARRALGTQ